MIARIRQALAEIAEVLGLLRPKLAHARWRAKRNFKLARRNDDRLEDLERQADELRSAGYPDAAQWRDKQAHKRRRKAQKRSDRAQEWLARVKRLNQRIHGLEVRRDELRAELKELRQRGVVIEGNTAKGGSKSERLKAVALASAEACSTGERSNFYSQPGAWDIGHVITGVDRDKRSDCSQWATAVYRGCGLADPNRNRYGGGYTGTQGAHGRVISVSEIQPGDLVLYGPWPHIHVELYVGPGDRTVGHGSAPIDPGVIDLFNDGDYEVRRYI